MTRVGILLVMGLAAAGCGGGADASGAPLLVFAAADLRDAFQELVPRFTQATGVHVELVLGSTGNLAAQVENGAPADLFFAADRSFLERVRQAGRVVPGSERVYAVGRLALAWRPGVVPPQGVEELADPRYRVVALANPEHAPYGRAARAALLAAGVWDEVAPRLVLGENIAHALQFVETGNADVGVVALSLVTGSRPREHRLVPDSLHPPLLQAAGVVVGGAVDAPAFLDFVMGPEGQTTLRRYGFEAPPE